MGLTARFSGTQGGQGPLAVQTLLRTASTMPINLFDGTMEGLSRALTLRQRQHEVLASNLANVETPGYRARDLDFGAALKEAFAATDGGEAVASPARVVEDTAAPARADGNTVDIDLQMVKLSANAGAYTTLARLLKDEFNDLRMAIEGR